MPNEGKRPSMFSLIRADIAATIDPTGRSRFKVFLAVLATLVLSEKVHAVIAFRISHVLWNNHLGMLAWLIRQRSISLYNCEIHPRAEIGPGFVLVHTTGINIGDDVTIGRNCRVHNHVLIGESGRGAQRPLQQPSIGDDVTIGALSLIAGDVHVGDGAVIGAHSYVIKDVEPDTVVVGVPARFLKPSTWRADHGLIGNEPTA